MLTWSAADPDRNPFDCDEEEEERLTALIATMVPSGPREGRTGWGFHHEVTRLLEARYGRWTKGWNGAVAGTDLVPTSLVVRRSTGAAPSK
ncbi:hypothetical protein ABZX30_16640 [Streptomyces sp. NPDC004542]|uniref:hypothetical protein n=1 Tax=Streptomyces sp. NPDC004542 TaxID=3154281 RepID=UPI0033B7018F